jgi:hypothetical protein
MRIAGWRQSVEQRFRLFQVLCVEAFGKPIVDQRKHVAGFGSIEAPEIFVVEDKEEAKKRAKNIARGMGPKIPRGG